MTDPAHADRRSGVEPPTRRIGPFFATMAPRLGRAIATAVVTCLPVAALAVAVREAFPPLVDLDQSLVAGATDVTRSHQGLWDFLLFWQELTLPWHDVVAAIPFVAVAWARGLRARAIWAAATILVGWNLRLDLSLLIERARPVLDEPVSAAAGYSFPSGHAFTAAITSAAIVTMFWPRLRDHAVRRTLAIAAGVTFTLVTALDRVFLGVHFPSDVTAGVLFALGLTYASWRGFVRSTEGR